VARQVEIVLECRPDLCRELVGVPLRRLRDRCLQSIHHRLARIESLRTDLALGALEKAIWKRAESLAGLVPTPIAKANTLAIGYTERLAKSGIEHSVGSVGDSYDNALAEKIIGLSGATR